MQGDQFADVRRMSPTAAGMNPPTHRSHRRLGWAQPQSRQHSYANSLTSAQIPPVHLNATYPPRQSSQPRQPLAGPQPRRIATSQLRPHPGSELGRSNSFASSNQNGPPPPPPKSMDAQWMKALHQKVVGAGAPPPPTAPDAEVTRNKLFVLAYCAQCKCVVGRTAADMRRTIAQGSMGTPHGPGAIGEGDKVVFLDVDGVLHPYHSRPNQQFRPHCMRRLKNIIDTTGAKIVLSTSWRRTARATAAVNLQLKRHEIPSAVDKTRIRHNEYLRNEEVLHWIDQHPFVTHWIAIDDLPMPQLGEHYIQTHPDTGLTDANVQQAIRVLTDPIYDRK